MGTGGSGRGEGESCVAGPFSCIRAFGVCEGGSELDCRSFEEKRGCGRIGAGMVGIGKSLCTI